MVLGLQVVRSIALGGVIPLFVVGLMYSEQKPLTDPNQLVRQTVQNELRSTNNGHRFMFKDTSYSKKGLVTKEVIQTPQGPLSRTIAIDGHPLTSDQRAKEDARLQKFANDLEARSKKRQSDKEESQREDSMVQTLPDAFVYTYAGTERGPNGSELVHLQFKPNPSFDPPNHETQVYLGMRGDLFIDAKAMRIVKIDGTLFKDVNFGWGILGKLYTGGRFIIEQQDIGYGVWDEVGETLKFTGKILLVKPLDIDSRETMTDFQPVPAQVTTAEALKLLHKADEVIAENGGGVATANPK